MKYNKVLKRKVYPTWVSTTRMCGCKVYIKQTPNLEYFFYEIICDDGTQISSLGDVDETKARFKDFDVACNTAEQWIKENIACY